MAGTASSAHTGPGAARPPPDHTPPQTTWRPDTRATPRTLQVPGNRSLKGGRWRPRPRGCLCGCSGHLLEGAGLQPLKDRPRGASTSFKRKLLHFALHLEINVGLSIFIADLTDEAPRLPPPLGAAGELRAAGPARPGAQAEPRGSSVAVAALALCPRTPAPPRQRPRSHVPRHAAGGAAPRGPSRGPANAMMRPLSSRAPGGRRCCGAAAAPGLEPRNLINVGRSSNRCNYLKGFRKGENKSNQTITVVSHSRAKCIFRNVGLVYSLLPVFICYHNN